jgi:hypothetical protein
MARSRKSRAAYQAKKAQKVKNACMAEKQEVAVEQTKKKNAEFDWAQFKVAKIICAKIECAEVACAACEEAANEREAQAEKERTEKARRAKMTRTFKVARKSQPAHRAKNAAQSKAMIELASL